MANLHSYRLELTTEHPATGKDVVEFNQPDTYRYLLLYEDGARISHETILAGEMNYFRDCDANTASCQEWSIEGRNGTTDAVLGKGAVFQHDWFLTAIDMAENVRVVGTESPDGTEAIHIRGSVNPSRVLVENLRRAFNGCLPGSAGSAEATCQPFNVEDALRNAQPGVDLLDASPADIDIWLSASGTLIHRAEVTYPQIAGAGQTIRVQWSRFNDVDIEVPILKTQGRAQNPPIASGPFAVVLRLLEGRAGRSRSTHHPLIFRLSVDTRSVLN